MNRLMSAVVVLCVAAGCSGSTTPESEGAPPASVSGVPSASTFTGTWRSVTPPLEFIRLTVTSKSSENDVLAARMTLSGVAWEGSGRIQGDAFVANMVISGSSSASNVLVARATDARTLRVQMRPANGPTTDLTFVRDD
jgi:hypothetical protein